MSIAGGVGRRGGSVLHPRICAAVTAASCLTHLGLAAGNQHGTWLNLLMLAMVAVCLPCAVHIWRHGRVCAVRQVSIVGRVSVFPRMGAVRQIMASALVMTGVHAVLLLGAGASAAGHAHHGDAAAPAAAASASAGSAAMLAVIALELTTAMVAATLLARLRVHRPD
ncbi:hypothetical protein ACFRJ8_09320 [Arthrobacter sp. NPDC056886]|uniref:hypothetical protein n=1 Tax=Arthrobacter sp. NPDC056886 TaxID=3345960 RepID=UPI00366DC3B4